MDHYAVNLEEIEDTLATLVDATGDNAHPDDGGCLPVRGCGTGFAIRA
jgi:hypothetical protein